MLNLHVYIAGMERLQYMWPVTASVQLAVVKITGYFDSKATLSGLEHI